MRRLPNSFSFSAIRQTWGESRDHVSSRAGAPGVDGLTAASFATNLSDHIHDIRRQVRDGTFRFSRLRMSPVAKSSGGYRIIAVPTVRDRLVQRCILRHLESQTNFRGSSAISYGFTKGRRLPCAQRAAVLARSESPWMLQSDIVKFFDQIPRDHLKELIRRRVSWKIVADLLIQAVDCELEEGSTRNAFLPSANGIVRGKGLRQGMPVSPLLSNLLLYSFDQELVRRGLTALRYADDIAVFCKSRAESLTALEIVRAALKRHGLRVPELEEGGKTIICDPSTPALFLGVEIKRARDTYKLYAPAGKLLIIEAEMKRIASIAVCEKEKRDIARTSKVLDSFIIGHRAAMSVLDNPDDFLKRLEAAKSRAITGLLVEILGKSVASRLQGSRRAIMGLQPF